MENIRPFFGIDVDVSSFGRWMRICPVHESNDDRRWKMFIAILEEDDASSLKMKNNYRPMLGLYLATSNHSGEKAFNIGKQ